ncbi:two-component system response regulator YesN [Paenibacillus endophyticus]|uniref:Two-component system response regulator YesN n=1 Tax=Paenibacillus endophyticus TaxID=1294268 RepID=A0A7W5G7U8_9BACL|nr:response regulator [Paenibacillus endophyticus]MBB3150324.1 two-component system response regulator YesN [Paenibacillus endophyticus]
MLRVLIVDDEFEIREGLRNRFPWDSYGIDEVLTADDGDTALMLALDKRPDLIVTDIKMNRMSGLDFLRGLVPVLDYKPESIVVSGFDDFELVKQAMQIGVLDYILKPINLKELDQIVCTMIDRIQKRQLDQHNEQLLLSQVKYAIPKMRDELLREMIEQDYDPYRGARRRHRLQTLDLEWIAEQQLTLAVIEADDLKAIENRQTREKDLILFGIGNVVNQTLEEENPNPFVLCTDSSGRWVVIFGCPRPEHAEQSQGMAQLCIQRINEFVKVKASAGMRTTPCTFEHLHEMFAEALNVLEQKAVYGGNRLFTEQGLYYEGDGGDLSLSEPDEVLDLVKYGSDEDITAAMERFVEMVQAWRLCQLRDIQQKIFEWLFEVFRRAASAGIPNKAWGSNPIAVWEQLEQFDTLQSLREQTEMFLHAIAADFRKLSATPSQIVTEAEKILHRDYAESLTLQSVAQAVHVTPVWLSKLFKKEKRKTFLEYLTEIRIEKAKDMLGDIQHKVYQISYQVGYKDPVHFSKLFKKQVGCTPKEYRRQRGIAEE